MSWHTKPKIIVFLGDDLGAGRMHSKKLYEVLFKKKDTLLLNVLIMQMIELKITII